ncbi:MAG: Rpn family recombination-promoting nuclease/putative transposase [Synergistaceae bacterium]|nr:Rpn family recombination-promoting nuclease/putative transposase [Synergistaceae bacterium]
MWSEEEIEARFNALNLPADRQWENLKLSNDFLFGKVMQDIEICSEMLRRILPAANIGKIRSVQIQAPIRSGVDSRGVRFDTLIDADEKKVLDVEMQTSDSIHLMKRTRAYHLSMGGNILEKGVSYIDLPDAFVIFICTFDPFKLGRHVYTFRKFCCENKKLELNDGETTMFLNAYGKDRVGKKMKAFLEFVAGRESDDPFIHEIKKRMDFVKLDRKWRQEYMVASIRETDLLYAGRTEGFEVGLKKGIAEGIAKGITEGDYLRQLKVARNMIAQGFDENTIRTVSELPVDEIRRLNT